MRIQGVRSTTELLKEYKRVQQSYPAKEHFMCVVVTVRLLEIRCQDTTND
jgi:hypothetical protein